MRESRHESTLGVAFNLYSVRAASDSDTDRDAARRSDGIRNRLFLDRCSWAGIPTTSWWTPE